MLRCLAVLAALLGGAAEGPARAETVEIETDGPKGALKALYLAPERAAKAAAVIIPGSGPTDRDGNGPLIKTNAYKLLAEALAARNVATARIDKRGMFSSKAAIANANHVTMSDYAGDVRAWARVVKGRAKAECVWLIGHSEGGLVALLAAQSPKDICGLVLLTTPGRRLGDMRRSQLAAAAKPLRDQAEAAIAALEKGDRVDVSKLHPTLRPLFYEDVQGFLISAFALDPAALIKAYAGPALILSAARDLQVSAADAKRLAEAKPDAKLATLKDVNHVLKTVTTDGVIANAATYHKPELPLAPGVAEAVAGFILKAR